MLTPFATPRLVVPVLAALLLAGVPGGGAAADDTASLRATPEGQMGARGLRSRVALSRNEGEVHVRAPQISDAPLTDPSPVEAREGTLASHVDLRLRPAPLISPAEAGRRMGHGDVMLSVPVNDLVHLRTGVRVDYDSSPRNETFEAEAIPTVGVGFEF